MEPKLRGTGQKISMTKVGNNGDYFKFTLHTTYSMVLYVYKLYELVVNFGSVANENEG